MVSGLRFPFRFENGKVAKDTGIEKVESDIKAVLSFGELEGFMTTMCSNLRRALFTLDKSAFEALVETYVSDAIVENVDYVEKILTVVTNWVDDYKAEVTVTYVLRNQNTIESATVSIG